MQGSCTDWNPACDGCLANQGNMMCFFYHWNPTHPFPYFSTWKASLRPRSWCDLSVGRVAFTHSLEKKFNIRLCFGNFLWMDSLDKWPVCKIFRKQWWTRTKTPSIFMISQCDRNLLTFLVRLNASWNKLSLVEDLICITLHSQQRFCAWDW